ncbi:MAG: DUF1853 family protein [Brumimicrobium sp.]|nr:DUF1853 family protein [Brumimicrobium sp.]
MWKAELSEFKNRVVGDLYWLLFSPCPVNENIFSYHGYKLFPQEILDDWQSNSKNYFRQLDADPSALENFLRRSRNKRLGFYAESLLSFFFQTYESTELLLQNYQLVDQGKTLGEIDFLIRWKNKIIHLECAVKYYLFDHSRTIDDLSAWIGPGGNDNLKMKMDKVIGLQLPLILKPQFGEYNKKAEFESYFFLKGKFYVSSLIQTSWINESALGNYIPLHDTDQRSLREGRPLNKPFWMSDLIRDYQVDNPTESALDIVFAEPLRKAVLIKLPGEEAFFVVPDNWPDHAMKIVRKK